MAKDGPIIIINEDKDDCDILEASFQEAGITNERIYFQLGRELMEYLAATKDKPMAILCDVYLPGINGVELKSQIEQDSVLKQKSVPFIFLSSASSQHTINDAYTNHVVQGFFRKPDKLPDVVKMLRTMFDYWQLCEHPKLVKVP
jgi:CheY-like chemotaxis protein